MPTKIKPPIGKNLFEFLREKYPVFSYQDFYWSIKKNSLHLQFLFRSEELEFKPKSVIQFPKTINLKKMVKSRKSLVDNLVFNIGMIELVSYWKATCSPSINVDCGYMSKAQRNWWKYLYYHGLGEFFYLNNIKADENLFVQINSVNQPRFKLNKRFKPSEKKILVPIGGGKVYEVHRGAPSSAA